MPRASAWRTVRTAGGLAAVLALLLAGCSAGPPTVGPFNPGGNNRNSGGECSWTTRGGVGTFGAMVFPNSGGPARIDKVTLVASRNLQLLAAWAVPVTGQDLIGVFRGYPPDGTGGFPGKPPPGVQWNHRQRADGALIPHTPGQDVINLVLVVRAYGIKGIAKSVNIDYESGGTRYRLALPFSMELFNGNRHGCLDKPA